MKAIVLLSGGLDSILAAKVVLEQGIEIEAVNFDTGFYSDTPEGDSSAASQRAAKQLGIPLKVFDISDEYLEVAKHPKYGYGKNLNPCIDCRIFTFKKAGDYMKATGASFLATGEVLGERPMSQRRGIMETIDRESGLEGLILRPLSAKLLEPTIPEKKGFINRENLLAFRGRSRKPQMELARRYNINNYPSPAGGCLLADPGFARRMRDLMEHNPEFNLNDVKLLKLGRHFRLSSTAKLVVGRNEKENANLFDLGRPHDIILDARSVPGPLALVRGEVTDNDIDVSASITARYTDHKDTRPVRIVKRIVGNEKETTLTAVPAVGESFEQMRI